MSTAVTLSGRMVRDPELKFSPNGKAVARFAVVTSRRFKTDDGAWEDKDTSFWECVAFGNFAENIAETLVKGTAVLVTGFAAQEEWTTRDGEKRRSMKVTVDDIAPTLRWASVKVNKAARSSGPEKDGDPWASDPPPF